MHGIKALDVRALIHINKLYIVVTCLSQIDEDERMYSPEQAPKIPSKLYETSRKLFFLILLLLNLLLLAFSVTCSESERVV